MQPLLLLAALLALLPARAAGGPGPSRPKLVWGHRGPGARAGAWLDVSSPVVRRTARTALSYYHYQQGSPLSFREPTYIKKASVKTIPGIGRKYVIQFGTKDVTTQELGTCLALVFYLRSKPKPAVDISCSSSTGSDQRRQLEYALLSILKENKNIPLKYLWGLGTLGSSFIEWEMSSEDRAYALTKIQDAQLKKRADDVVEGDFKVVLSDDSNESPISCYMRVIWMPGQDVQVKYDCNPDSSADGSGEELGSTEFFINSENNF